MCCWLPQESWFLHPGTFVPTAIVLWIEHTGTLGGTAFGKCHCHQAERWHAKPGGMFQKGGKELFLCWSQNSQKFFFLYLGSELWVGFSSNHEPFTWIEIPECSSKMHHPCQQIRNEIHFSLGHNRVSWLLFLMTECNYLHIFNKWGTTLDLPLVTIYAVVWALHWGVYSAIVIPSPTAHRVKAL